LQALSLRPHLEPDDRKQMTSVLHACNPLSHSQYHRHVTLTNLYGTPLTFMLACKRPWKIGAQEPSVPQKPPLEEPLHTPHGFAKQVRTPSIRIQSNPQPGSRSELKGEPLARETASKTDVMILSWPLKRYFSTLVFDTVAHSALSARQPWIRQTFTLTLYEKRFASRTGTGSVKSNPQGGTFAKSNLHAPFSTLLQGLSTHERTPPHALS